MSKAAIKLPAKNVLIDTENFALAELPDGTFLGCNRKPGRTLDSEGFKVLTKKSKIDHLGVNAEGKPFVMIQTTADELLKIAKNAKQAERQFAKIDRKRGAKETRFLKHLNPEVTFCLSSPIRRQKTKQGK